MLVTMESAGVLWRVWGQEGAGYWSGQTVNKEEDREMVATPLVTTVTAYRQEGNRHRENGLWNVGMRACSCPPK